MKKTVFTLFVLLVCVFHNSKAYEYFTIYFTDGTKSEAFYAIDVDSICYSKLSLDGITYDDWQVQEIYTCDSVYRYPLAQIDSISFKDVDADKAAEKMERIEKAIIPLYKQCQSTEELKQNIIEAGIPEVTCVWSDQQTVSVEIDEVGTIVYLYLNEEGNGESEVHASFSNSNTRGANLAPSDMNLTHHHANVQKVCVLNQNFKDESRIACRVAAAKIKGFCNQMGFNININNDPTPQAYIDDVFNSDIAIIMTHGTYSPSKSGRMRHWLATSVEFGIGQFDIDKWKTFTKSPDYSPEKYNLIVVDDEKRNGRDGVVVHYLGISDFYIAANLTNRGINQPGPIIFNNACQSLMGNNSLADIYMNAAFYAGYDNTSLTPRGAGAAVSFFENLLNGYSAVWAFQMIPEVYATHKFTPRGSNKEITAKLDWAGNNPLLCITHPETLEAEEEAANLNSIILSGRVKTIATQGKYDIIKYDFQISRYSDMSVIDALNCNVSIDSSSLPYLCWNVNIDKKLLQPNTTYYYRAYMNDGFSNCYGEVKTFTTTSTDAEAYAVLKDSVLTFYYDGKKKERIGDVCLVKEKYTYDSRPFWRGIIKKAIFDPSFANYAPVSTAYWFHDCRKLTQIENLQYLNTSNVTEMHSMFVDCSDLTSLDVSHFNTSNVRVMNLMFCGCSSLTSLDLSSFDTSNVRDMSGMFSGCSSLTRLDLSSFDTSNVTNMEWMFEDCYALMNLDVSHFNTSNVTNMYRMFVDCRSLTSLDVSHFNTSKVTAMDGMFAGCRSLTHLDVSKFTTSNVTGMGAMFCGCKSLTSLDVRNFDTSNVKNMRWDGFNHGMFAGCSSLTSLDLSSFNTSNVTDMYGMFSNCSSLTSLDLSSFNTSNVTDMSHMFFGCSSLTSLDLSSFNTSNVTTMGAMFYGCISLTSIDFRNLVLNSYCGNGLFNGLKLLKSINLRNANTKNALGMSNMFLGCSSLTSLDLSSFNTSNVTDMESMFLNCSSLTSLDLSSFNTSNVTDMESMFSNCSSLTSLDLSSFNTSNVTNMEWMFSWCSSLVTIYAGNWNRSSKDLSFEDCKNLVGGKGTKIWTNYVYDSQGFLQYSYNCPSGGTAAHIDGGKDWPGLFTAK